MLSDEVRSGLKSQGRGAPGSVDVPVSQNAKFLDLTPRLPHMTRTFRVGFEDLLEQAPHVSNGMDTIFSQD